MSNGIIGLILGLGGLALLNFLKVGNLKGLLSNVPMLRKDMGLEESILKNKAEIDTVKTPEHPHNTEKTPDEVVEFWKKN